LEQILDGALKCRASGLSRIWDAAQMKGRAIENRAFEMSRRLMSRGWNVKRRKKGTQMEFSDKSLEFDYNFS